ncbi:MAG: DUF1573 domain-containing protein [Bacteroidia bacterium]|nr:DUF1573 domain-containing protein [Bacteroidia bacterium]
MKSISKYSFLFFVFVFAKISLAQNNADENAPVLKFEKDTMNFGTVAWNSDQVRIMKFTNIGKSPLVISRSTGSCGCIVTEHSKEPILPGKSGFIKVRYDTKRPGPIYKVITIESNSRSYVNVETVKGNDETGTLQTVIVKKKIPSTFPLIGKILPPPPTSEENFQTEKKTD